MDEKQILDELIEAVPEIHGAFLSGSSLLVSGQLQEADIDELQLTAEKVIKNHRLARTHFDDILYHIFSFEQTAILAAAVHQEKWLFVLYSKSVAHALLERSVTMCLSELQASSGNGGSTQSDMQGENNSAGQAGEVLSLEELIEQRPDLTTLLADLQHQLNKVMGPMADIILADSLDDWQSKTAAGTNELKILVEIICREIGDASTAEKFTSRLSELS